MCPIASAVGLLDAFNPLSRWSQGEYLDLWQFLFATILSGFWARFFAVLFLALAFWFAVYRRRFALGVFLFGLTVTITYLGGLIGMMFWWVH